ncbi:unnamed protein product, partial [Gongylonema pulchrum]|uniref:GOLD domain-containing protein n=1 Tax=Gongylonema pulchrum TaxID=637853 RepID=A0A183DMR0_9BILA
MFYCARSSPLYGPNIRSQSGNIVVIDISDDEDDDDDNSNSVEDEGSTKEIAEDNKRSSQEVLEFAPGIFSFRLRFEVFLPYDGLFDYWIGERQIFMLQSRNSDDLFCTRPSSSD